MLNSSKVRLINYQQKLNIRYITSLGISLLLLYNIPVVFYRDAYKQKANILKDNNKKSGIYR